MIMYSEKGKTVKRDSVISLNNVINVIHPKVSYIYQYTPEKQ